MDFRCVSVTLRIPVTAVLGRCISLPMKRALAITGLALFTICTFSVPPLLADHHGDSVFLDDFDDADDERDRSTTTVSDPDTNSCVEGSVIGGLLGAGLGAALSRGNGRWIGVPLGGAAGALVGCQVDGG